MTLAHRLAEREPQVAPHDDEEGADGARQHGADGHFGRSGVLCNAQRLNQRGIIVLHVPDLCINRKRHHGIGGERL